MGVLGGFSLKKSLGFDINVIFQLNLVPLGFTLSKYHVHATFINMGFLKIIAS